MDIEVE